MTSLKIILFSSQSKQPLKLLNPSIDYLTCKVINETTDGGADYCFECVGQSSLIKEAFACCRKVSLYIYGF